MIILSAIGMFSITIGVNKNVLNLYLFGVPFTGLSCTVGNQTILGFIKTLNPKVISGYASGTGFAGIFGSVFFFVVNTLDMTYETCFSILFSM